MSNQIKKTLLVFFGSLIVFLSTMRLESTYSDVASNTIQASNIADGKYFTDEFKGQGEVLWLAETDKGYVSKYPPGVGFYGSIFYMFAPDETIELQSSLAPDDSEERKTEIPIIWPGSTAAAVAAAVSVCFVFLSLRFLYDETTSYIGTFIYGFCTSVWSIASASLWMHSVDAPLITGGVYFYIKKNYWVAGAMMGAAIMVRPTTAVMLIPVGLKLLLGKDIKSFIKLSSTPTFSAMSYVAYNYWLYGKLTISGGYTGNSIYEDRLSGGYFFSDFFKNAYEGTFSPGYGLILASPVLFVIGWFSVRNWKKVENNTGVFLVAAALYMTVQWGLNRASGGLWVNYRYPLEALYVLPVFLSLGIAPALRSKYGKMLLLTSIMWSVVFQINYIVSYHDSLLNKLLA